jgi:DNA polymerase-3 subunit chi
VTEVSFHFGTPDKRGYALRLIRKAVGTGAKLWVLGDGPLLQELDSALWSLTETEFLTHCRADASEDILLRSSVVLVPANFAQSRPEFPVLVNLSSQMPPNFEAHARVIEVVSTQEDDKDSARIRWAAYTKLGYAIVRHDLNLRS